MKNRDRLFFITAFILSGSRAFAAGGYLDSVQTYSCLGLDNMPITGQPLEGECCDANGLLIPDAPSSCTGAFNSISGDATTSAASNISIAQAALNAAQQMNGATTNFNNVIASTTGLPGPGSTVETSAATAGPSTTATSGTTTTDPAFSSATPGASSDGSGGSASGSGGPAGGLDTSASASASASPGSTDSSATDGSAGNQGVTLAYVPNNGANGGGNGYGNGGSGVKFGGGFGAKKVDGKDLADQSLAFGSADKNAAGAKNNALDEDAGATADDPADYFSKVDLSANLFKIVSNRYFKKKSLWKVKSE